MRNQYSHTLAIYFIAFALQDLYENINSDQYEVKKQLYNVIRQWVVDHKDQEHKDPSQSLEKFFSKKVFLMEPSIGWYKITEEAKNEVMQLVEKLKEPLSKIINECQEYINGLLNHIGSIVSL